MFGRRRVQIVDEEVPPAKLHTYEGPQSTLLILPQENTNNPYISQDENAQQQTLLWNPAVTAPKLFIQKLTNKKVSDEKFLTAASYCGMEFSLLKRNGNM